MKSVQGKVACNRLKMGSSSSLDISMDGLGVCL